MSELAQLARPLIDHPLVERCRRDPFSAVATVAGTVADSPACLSS